MERKSWLREGMVAVVTGASSGIGECIARRLAAEGVVVACLSRSAAETASSDGRLIPIACDIRDADSVREAVDRIVAETGGIDILVNAAGVSMPEPLSVADTEPAIWQRIVDTNLTGLFYMTHFAMPHLRESGGYIIDILSTAAFRSNAGNAPYSASKYGARAVCEASALEGKDRGVRVASISPGPVNTNIWSHKTTPPDAETKSRMLDPDDIADIALFLLKTPGSVVIENVTVTPRDF